jgi:hypothetical protein
MPRPQPATTDISVGSGHCAPSGAVVIPFVPRRKHRHSLSVFERIQAIEWADAARERGVRAVRIHEPGPDDDADLEPYLLVYERHNMWATWGVTVRPGSFEVWRPSTGASVSQFGTLLEALGAIGGAASN